MFFLFFRTFSYQQHQPLSPLCTCNPVDFVTSGNKDLNWPWALLLVDLAAGSVSVLVCLVGCCGRSNVVDTLSLSVCFFLPSSLCSRWYFDGLATLGSSRSYETQIEFATSRFVAAANHIAWQYQFILAFIMAKMKDRAHHRPDAPLWCEQRLRSQQRQRAAAEKSAHLPTARFMICLLDCRARLSQSQSHSQSPSGSATGTRLCSHHLRIFRSNKINKNALILRSLSKHAVRSSCVPPTLYPANICTGYAILMTSTKDRRASAASASASATASAKSSASSH